MEAEKEKWWKRNGRGGLAFDMAKFFTEDMSQDLKQLSQFYARNYIESIHKKAQREYQKKYSEKSIDLKINIMEIQVRTDLFKRNLEVE